MAVELGTAYYSLALDTSAIPGQMSQAFGSAGSSASSAGQSAGGAFSGAFGLAAAAGAVAAGALLMKGITSALDFSEVTNKLANQLGATGAEAGRLGQATGDAYRTGLYGSMQEAADAVGAVQSAFKNLGKDGERSLTEVTRTANAFSKTFDVEVAEGVQTASQLIVNGLAKDSTEAFDLMTKSFQSVPAAMRGEIPELINEYGTFFADLGFDGAQAFGLLTSAADKGKWALDKTGDALKEFNIRGQDGSKGVAEAYEGIGKNAEEMFEKVAQGGPVAGAALAETAAGILTLGTHAERSQAAIALFGTPVEDLGTRELPQFLDALANGAQGLDGFAGSSDALADSVGSTLTGKFNALKATIEMGFVEALTSSAKWLNENQDVVLAVGAALGVLAIGFGIGPTIAAFSSALAAAKTAMLAMNAAMLANPMILVVVAIAALAAGFVLLYNRSETFRNIVQQVWAAIQTAISYAWENVIKPVWEQIKSWLPIIGQFFVDLWNIISDVFVWIADKISWWWNNIVQPVWEALKVALGFVGDAFSVWWNVVSAILEVAKTAFQIWWNVVKIVFNLFRIGIEALASVFRWLWDTIVSPVMGWIGDKISDIWNNTVSPVWENFKTGLKILGDKFKEMWDKYVKPAWDALKSGLDSGWQLIEKGINSGIGLFEKLRDAVKKVFDWISDKWDTFSGMIDKVSDVTGAIGDFLGGVSGNVTGHSEGGWTGPGGKYDPAGIVHADEYVISKAARNRFEAENPGLLDYINRTGKLPEGIGGYAEGGRVGSDRLVQFAKGVEGKPYVWGGVNWGDCSGAISALANFATGLEPFASRFATGSQAEGLADRGFKSGKGPDGSLRIGWFNGGPYGGHTSATLPNGVNFEMGGARGNGQYGGQAVGADHSQYTDHAYLPMEAEKPLDGLERGKYEGGTSESDSTSSTSGSDDESPKEKREQELKDSITGNFGAAADSFVSGQIGSVLDSFGAPDSPSVLKAATAWNDAWADQADYEKEQAEWEAGQSSTPDVSTVEPSKKETLSESPTVYDPAKGPAQWKPVVEKALEMLGNPLSDVDRTLEQVGIESNGDPNAVNDYDVNAQNGDPSKGLLQVIGKTFKAYRSPSLPDDQFDPLSNIFAGANYAKDRYGSLEQIWPTKKGYDNGGWLQPGFTLVENKTGKPEPVFNPSQWDDISSLVDAGGARGNGSGAQEHVHYHTEGINDAMRKENLRRRTGAASFGWR